MDVRMGVSISDKITDLLVQDESRMDALRALRDLDLPQGFIAARFLRNLVWDHLHVKAFSTKLNDIDVIYFCSKTLAPERDFELQRQLLKIYPSATWQVRNQARMHLKNDDSAYLNVTHAMSHWPEKETAVAVRLNVDNTLEFSSAFGLERLYNLTISHNPVRSVSVFKLRISEKQWQSTWPKLNVIL